jgi:hypothetical protein
MLEINKKCEMYIAYVLKGVKSCGTLYHTNKYLVNDVQVPVMSLNIIFKTSRSLRKCIMYI